MDAARLHELRLRIARSVATLAELESAIDVAESVAATAAALDPAAQPSVRLVVRPAFAADGGRREGAPDALVRVGGGHGGWLPLLVTAHRLTEATRSPRARGMRVSAPADLPGLAALPDLTGLDADPAHKARSERARTDGLELAHHWRRLESLGLAPPSTPTGGVLDSSGRVWWLDLSAERYPPPTRAPAGTRASLLTIYDAAFAERLAVAERALARLTEPALDPLVSPVRIGECKTCPWWRQVCRPWLEDRDHVSLLPGQGNRERVALHAARGVRTRRDVALLAPDSEAYAGLALRPALPELVDEARAVVSGRPWRRRSSDPASLRADLAMHAVEVDIDMENAADGAAYLWGLWVTRAYLGPGRSEPEYIPVDDYRPLTAQVHLDLTRRLAVQLHALRHEAALAGGSLALYHWSPAEFRPLAALERAGLLTETTLRHLGVTPRGSSLRGPEWIDLEEIWRRHVRTGGRSSLKAVVRIIDPDFDYEVDDPGGAQAQAHHQRAVADHAAAKEGEAAPLGAEPSASVAWLRTYNRSDVRATARVRHWMRTTLPMLPSIARWSPAHLTRPGSSRP